jgi:hypothetical protein
MFKSALLICLGFVGAAYGMMYSLELASMPTWYSFFGWLFFIGVIYGLFRLFKWVGLDLLKRSKHEESKNIK